MSTVTSSYNFVPLNEKVCVPEWANSVSQDIPLKGAISGSIKLDITAKTPVFVRGKCIINHANAHQEFQFMKHNNRFCIPGSSLKGTIANVLEILTFGKLQKVNDHRFSQRDWENDEIYDKQGFAKKNRGGWLYYDKNDECYKMDYNTRSIGRITHEAIDKHYRTDFQNIFGRKFDPKEVGENKSALKKYKLIEEKKRQNNKLQLKSEFSAVPDKDSLYTINSSTNDGTTGTLVFSGQPSKREFINGEWRGKNKEFIFWESNVKGVNVDDLMDDFLFAYYDHDPKQMTDDWEYWREALAKGEPIPVFLQLDDDKRDENGNKKIKHFGLSMLYKLPFKNRITDLLPAAHKNSKKDENTSGEEQEIAYDFVETIFGYSIGQDSSKGRVSFKHAFADEDAQESTPKTLVLGEPKASYYPFYLKQKFKATSPTEILRDFQTYDDSATLAGRKRYPIKHIDESLGAEKSAFSTTFTPLHAGTVFTTEIVYHNLLPEELGALLCALTFNGVNDCYHGIGMAKPYGYGAAQIDISMDVALRNQAMLAFRAHMESWWLQQKEVKTWSESEQLQQLIAMARFSDQTAKLSYMELETFPKIKKEKKALPRFTKFLGIESFSYPESYQKEINGFVEVEKQRLAAIKEEDRLKKEAEKKVKEEREEAEKKSKAEKERKETLEKGLIAWLPKTDDYGVIAKKMNEWIVKRNDEFITDETEVTYLLANVTKSRNKKAPRFRDKFFNEKKKNDLIKWIGSDETDNFLQNQ